jgi:hypothetical protein
LKWAAPSGGGSWTTWTPTIPGLTQGNGTLVARYIQVGKVVNFYLAFTFGSTSSISSLNFTLPVTPSQTYHTFLGSGDDVGSGNFPLAANSDGGTAYTNAYTAGGTYVGTTGVNATVPFTWGTNDRLNISGSYEVA